MVVRKLRCIGILLSVRVGDGLVKGASHGYMIREVG